MIPPTHACLESRQTDPPVCYRCRSPHRPRYRTPQICLPVLVVRCWVSLQQYFSAWLALFRISRLTREHHLDDCLCLAAVGASPHAGAAAPPESDSCRHDTATTSSQRFLRIAVQGCGHGELDAIYTTIAEMERSQRIKIDLLLCCGDFQAVRFKSDLECMAVPAKFRKLGSFYRYCTNHLRNSDGISREFN